MIDAAPLVAHVQRAIAAIPSGYRQAEVIRGLIVCLMSELLRGLGLIPVPRYKPPRSSRERIDLLGLDAAGEVACAVAVDQLITLERVKAVGQIDCPHRFFVTFSPRADKVAESRFFLSDGITHIDIGSKDLTMEMMW